MNSNINKCEKSHVANGLSGLNANSQTYLSYDSSSGCPCADCVSAPVCKYSEDCMRLCDELGVGKTTDKPFSVAVRCCHKYSVNLPSSLDIMYCNTDAVSNCQGLDESLSLTQDPLT